MSRSICAALLTALVLAASASLGSALGVPRLILQAQENLSLDEDPTGAAVAFRLRKGDADPTWDVFASEVLDEDLRGIASWQLQLFDAGEKKVSYLQGRGEPPRTINWFGLSSEGYLLPDGFYKARLVWTDASRAIHKTAPISASLLAREQMRAFLGPSVTLSFFDQGLIIRVVEGMIFPMGDVDIQPESLPVLAKIARFLRSHPRNQLVIEGHTDSTGAGDVNERVSEQRAKAVFEYLLEAGVSPSRLSYRGRGADAPIASNATVEGRARNRRVEIRVMKIGS